MMLSHCEYTTQTGYKGVVHASASGSGQVAPLSWSPSSERKADNRMERMMEFQAPRLTAPALPSWSVSGWSLAALILGALAVWLLIGLVVALVIGRVVSLGDRRRPRPAEPSPATPQHRDAATPTAQTGRVVHDEHAPEQPPATGLQDGTAGVATPTVEPYGPASNRTARPDDQQDVAGSSRPASSRRPGHRQVAGRGPTPSSPHRTR